MASNQSGNGRNVALPDENRPSWRPQDQRLRPWSGGDEGRDRDDRVDDRDASEHHPSRPRGYWEDDRYEGARIRQSDSFGQGQRGHAEARYGEDRSMRFHDRNEGSWHGGYGQGDRLSSGRGGGDYWMDRQDRGPGPGWSSDQSRGPSSQGWQGGQREPQRPQGPHRGKGPQGYIRSDERIRELVCEALSDDPNIDATYIDVVVNNGEVFLTGTVEDRQTKRAAEDVVENCPGVKDVQNQLRVLGVSARGAGRAEPRQPEPDPQGR
ncbi:MAG: transport-associated protein [Deltaproteobacteria bacterium]|nr:transport-associated protein [Deltaproteobacteria bacterium]